jgi:hypothetical protein
MQAKQKRGGASDVRATQRDAYESRHIQRVLDFGMWRWVFTTLAAVVALASAAELKIHLQTPSPDSHVMSSQLLIVGYVEGVDGTRRCSLRCT